MTARLPPADAYLQLDPANCAVIAQALRERETTLVHTTVVPPSRDRYARARVAPIGRRWWVRLTVALTMAVLAACGGGEPRRDTYAKATDAQGQCCENLAGPERDRCLSEIVRVDDPAAARTSTNQATYACVAEHFVCDPRTGRPTQPSAQAQYDCIEDQTR